MYFNVDDVQNRFPDSILQTLIGGTYDFYGVDNNSFCIGVNGSRIVLEAVEDPSDGYRSYFGCFRTTDVDRIFFKQAIARVQLRTGGMSDRSYISSRWDAAGNELPLTPEHLRIMRENFTGWELVDPDTGHVWLTVGTDHGDDYYPCFTFRYTPDPDNRIEEDHDD